MDSIATHVASVIAELYSTDDIRVAGQTGDLTVRSRIVETDQLLWRARGEQRSTRRAGKAVDRLWEVRELGDERRDGLVASLLDVPQLDLLVKASASNPARIASSTRSAEYTGSGADARSGEGTAVIAVTADPSWCELRALIRAVGPPHHDQAVVRGGHDRAGREQSEGVDRVGVRLQALAKLRRAGFVRAELLLVDAPAVPARWLGRQIELPGAYEPVGAGGIEQAVRLAVPCGEHGREL